MIVRDVCSDVLLGLAVAIVLGALAGRAGDARRLSEAALRDAGRRWSRRCWSRWPCWCRWDWTENTGETWLALFFMVIAGPFLSHATIRAIRVREKGDWRAGTDAGAAGEEPER